MSSHNLLSLAGDGIASQRAYLAAQQATQQSVNAGVKNRPDSCKPLPGSLPSASFKGAIVDAQALAASMATKSQAPLGTAPPGPLPELLARDARERALDKVLQAAVKQAEARKAGVDLAKSNYFIKLMTFAGVAVTFGVTLALTVATAGAAAPMMALTSMRLAMAIGDVYYARKCVGAAQESLKQGRPVAGPPMGGSCVGNWLHAYRTWRGDDDAAARSYATSRGAIFTISLSLAMLVTGTMWTPAAAGAAQISKWVSSSVMGLMVPYELRVGYGDTRKQAGRTEDASELFNAAHDAATAELTEDDRRWLKDLLEDALGGVKGQAPLARKELDDLLGIANRNWPQRPVDANDRKVRKEREEAQEAWRSTTRLYIAANTSLGFFKTAASVYFKLT